MEIIAKTAGGVMIAASSAEVKEILSSVIGRDFAELEIGQKIPAIDYASSIKKLKGLGGAHEFETVCQMVERFNRVFGNLKEAITKAASLEI